MKKIFNLFKKRTVKTTASQEELIEFVKDKENLKKAAEGSMQKRIELIDRVKLRRKNA